MAEVNFYSQECLQLLVLLKEQIIVGRDGSQFGVSPVNRSKCPMYIFDGHGQNFFQKRDSELTVCDRQNASRAASSRFNEICFYVSYPSPSVNDSGPYINEFTIG